jgi:phage I-like protein
MARLDLATCEAALPPGAAPEWVHLLPPKGRITARDGRQFVARECTAFAGRKSFGFAVDDPARLVADFEGRAVDLPVDFAHQTELADPKSGGPAPRGGLDQGTSPRPNRPLCLGGMDRPRRRDDRGAGIPHPFARVPA